MLPTDPKQLAKLIIWLAALGGVVLVGSVIVSRTAGKARAQL